MHVDTNKTCLHFVVDGVQVEPMMKKETSPHNQVPCSGFSLRIVVAGE